MVAPELKLTKKVTADKEGAGPHCQKLCLKERQRLNPEDCPGCAALALHGKATKPHNDECRERVGTIIERTLTGKARMNAHKDRIAETERVKERKRARVERGAGGVPLEPGNRDDEQVAVRHADAPGGDIRENPARREQNESQKTHDRMRDTHIGKRGSEAASGEQPDKLRKTVRFEQKTSASASSDPNCCSGISCEW